MTIPPDSILVVVPGETSTVLTADGKAHIVNIDSEGRRTRPHHPTRHPSWLLESTADLVKKIDRFIRTHNANSQSFVWTATADSILQKLARLCQRISGTEH